MLTDAPPLPTAGPVTAPVDAAPAGPARQAEARGLWLGLLGVVMFAITTPMTRLAIGPADAPQLPPLFVTAGRAALAGLLSAAYLWVTKAPRPARAQWPALTLTGAGVVIGFPLFLALALRDVAAIHAAVITGVLPLATAAVAALVLRQRPSAGFWGCAVIGCALVLGYAAWQGGGQLGRADGLLLAGVLSASIGYVYGAQLSLRLRAEQVICWVLVGALPLTLPVTAWTAGGVDFGAVRTATWGAFGYVSLFSMWLGFFAWYRGLAIGGTVRVSQVQLVQPFVSMLAAVPLLGERLDVPTLAFALAVIGSVMLGRRMPVGVRTDRSPARDFGSPG